MSKNDEESENGAKEETFETKKPFSKVPRELGEADLRNPSISKMLLSQIDKLEIENRHLKEYEEKFHVSDKEVAILKERTKINVFSEILSQFCLALGGGLLSVSTADFTNGIKVNNGIFLIFGGVCILGAVISIWGKNRWK